MIFANIDPQARKRWHDKRKRIEQEIVNTNQRSSFHGPRTWLGRHISRAMNFFVRLSGLYARGRRNALNLSVQNLDFSFPDLPSAFDGYKIMTVDLATLAADLGYNLYLSGHTHGGQVCLLGGRPVLTALDSHRHLASGRWKVRNMLGYTSRGLGYGFAPYRFNCPPEVTVINFHKG